MAKLRDDPVEIVKRYNDYMASIPALTQRWESDYEAWRLTPFAVDASEGEWDSYTTNGPAVLGNKSIEAISQGDLMVKIALTDETDKEEDELTQAEDICLGLLNMLDKNFIAEMEPPVVGQLSWYAVLRGSWYQLLYVHKDVRKVRKNGKLVEEEITLPDLKIWDGLRTYAQLGKGGFKYIIHKRTTDALQLKDEYDLKDNVIDPFKESKTSDKVTAFDYWDDEVERVILGKTEGPEVIGDVIWEVEHKLGYVSAAGFRVGTVPNIESDRVADAYADRGESIYVNTRHIPAAKSRLLSYYITIAGLQAKRPLKIYYRGQKPDVPQSPYVKGREIYLDLDKGQEMKEADVPTLPSNFSEALSIVSREESMGGLSPVTYGYADAAMPVGTTNMLIHGARELLKSRGKAVELGLEWICNEFLHQFKEGGVPDMELAGAKATGNYFKIKVSPKDIKEEWQVEVKIKPNLPQDEMLQTQIAETWAKSKLTSLETARERLPIRDPNAEQDKIDAEDMHNLPPIKFREAIAEFQAEGRDDLAQILAEQLQNQELQAGAQAGAPPGGNGNGNNPALNAQLGSTNRAMMLKQEMMIPDEVKKAVEGASLSQRLRRLGMVRGR